MHPVHLLLGGAAPAVLIALVVVHFRQQRQPATPPRRAETVHDCNKHEPYDRAWRARTALPVEHVGAEDNAATTQWIGAMRELEERTVGISRDDLRTLFQQQDREIGEEYVRRLESRLAANFALVELTGEQPTLTPGGTR